VPPGSAGALTRITSAFDLGVYEVTAARFATFVDATAGNLRGAAAGLAGFAAAHAQYLPTTRGEVDDALGPACKFRGDPRNFGARTWWSQDVEDAVAGIMTDQNDRAADIRADATKERLAAKPSNCVSYYMAEAFCAWDGGRLPTSEEWIYAALGGEELREYPWGSGRTHERLVTDLNRSQNGGPADAQFTFPEDFPYFDNGMNAYHIAPPGRKPAGASRWGQQDMAGNVLEWMADILGPDAGIVRGGSWEGHADANAVAYTNYPLDRTYGSVGFRCAYGPRQAGDGPAAPDANAMLVPLHLSLNEANADWLLTRTESEGEPVFHHRGIQMRVLGAAPAGADVAPLYRCITPGGRHLASNQPDCEGLGTSEGMLGYTYKNAVANALPVYRCSTVLGNHVSTLYAAECNFPGMKIDGTQGFAFPR
jgi:formylglycine-generating enzyme required for sulfatase activity